MSSIHRILCTSQTKVKSTASKVSTFRDLSWKIDQDKLTIKNYVWEKGATPSTDVYENSAYDIQNELLEKYPEYNDVKKYRENCPGTLDGPDKAYYNNINTLYWGYYQIICL